MEGDGRGTYPEWLIAPMENCPTESASDIPSAVLPVVHSVLSLFASGNVDPDDALMKDGLDSFSAFGFRNALPTRAGCPLPATRPSYFRPSYAVCIEGS